MESRSHVVVVGGVAAGPKAAVTIARRCPHWRVTLFESGEYISYGTCGMPYFASGDVSAFEALTQTGYGVERTVEFFRQSKGIEVITGAEVIAINRERKTVTVRATDGSLFEHGYDKLVLATGSRPKQPTFPCEASPRIRHFTRPDDALAFRRLAEQGKIGEAVIIGGGFIGCELAEAAGGMWGITTTLLEYEDRVLPYALDSDMAALVRGELERNGVTVSLGSDVQRVAAAGERVSVTYATSRGARELQTLEADYVFLSVGVQPNVELARSAGLALGRTGGIRTNHHLQTSDPDIYAGGDCVESHSLVSGGPIHLPMGSLANRHGRVIGEHISGYDARFPGVVGAMVVKVFDVNVGSVGLTERAAAAAGISAQAVTGAFTDRPDYYPEHESMVLKMVYDAGHQRILGLQAVGKGDVCRRIDVFSALVQRQATVKDLLQLEPGYAPPYAEAMDPLHHLAAMVAARSRGTEFVGACRALAGGQSALWLDVRELEEAASSPLGLSDGVEVVSIPLGELRDRLDRLDRNREIYIVCRRGPRSYQAARMLQANGFMRVKVVGGGTTALGQ